MNALITLPDDGRKNYFVFGSNLRGLHAGGAARFAREHYRAETGVAVGHTGDAFAIPTMGRDMAPLPLDLIGGYVAAFIECAKDNPTHMYYVTPIGCGIAGFTPAQMAPLFASAPANCILPDEFTAVLNAQPARE